MLKPVTYLKPSQRFRIEFFAKTVKSYNYFSKAAHLRSLTRFWILIHLSINTHELDPTLCIVWDISSTLSLSSDIFRYIHVLFRHMQPYCGIFRTICKSYIPRTQAYSESWHIWKPRYIQGSVKAFSGIFRTLCNVGKLRTLPCSELCHIQNVGLFTTRGIFRILFILAHSGIFRHIK